VTDRELDALVAIHVFGAKDGADFWSRPDHEFVRCDEGCQSDAGWGATCGLMREMCVRCEDIQTPSCDHYTVTERCEKSPNPYSSSVACAFLVVEAMRAKGWEFSLHLEPLDTGEPSWEAMFETPDFRDALSDAGERGTRGIEYAESAPRAICLAALRALNVEVQP